MKDNVHPPKRADVAGVNGQKWCVVEDPSARRSKRGRAVCCRAAATGVCERAEGHRFRHHALEGTHLTHFFSSMVPSMQNTPRSREHALVCFEAAVVGLTSPIFFNLVPSIHVVLGSGCHSGTVPLLGIKGQD